jgi:hypothetical protein
VAVDLHGALLSDGGSAGDEGEEHQEGGDGPRERLRRVGRGHRDLLVVAGDRIRFVTASSLSTTNGEKSRHSEPNQRTHGLRLLLAALLTCLGPAASSAEITLFHETFADDAAVFRRSRSL